MNDRILVVDDEESLRLSMKFKLKSAGFDVDTAVDGEEALEKLKAKPVDVVLLDINMPRHERNRGTHDHPSDLSADRDDYVDWVCRFQHGH